MTDLFVKGVGKVLVEICEGVLFNATMAVSPMPPLCFFNVLARVWHNTTINPAKSLGWQRIFHPILSVSSQTDKLHGLS